MTEARCHLVFGGGKVAGTPAIAAPGTSYAIAFTQLMKNAELLPPSAADCAADMIDENEEDTSRRLRRQPVHRNGSTPVAAGAWRQCAPATPIGQSGGDGRPLNFTVRRV